MSNNLNLSLTSFFTPTSSLSSFQSLNAVEGVDYIISGKSLLFPTNSPLLSSITTIQTTNSGLSTFYGNQLTSLTAVNIIAPNLTVFVSPPNLTHLSAINIGLSSLELSGGNFTNISIVSSNNLRNIDLSRVRGNISTNLNLSNNVNLSSLNIGSTPVLSLTGIRSLVFNNNNLDQQFLNSFFTSLCAAFLTTNDILSVLNFYVANTNLNSNTLCAAFNFFTNRGANLTTINTDLSTFYFLISQLS